MSDWNRGRVTVLLGRQNGKYPEGNSLLVRGDDATLLIDPSLRVARGEAPEHVDLVLLSHVHEDHVAGLGRYPTARVLAHRADVLGVHSLAGLLQMYGYSGIDEAMRSFVVDQFHYAARPDAESYVDGQVFDLGGVSVEVIHLPGHTRGHCALRIEPEGVLFLGDIDLSSFGPYYGDAWSDLADFERSLARVRDIEASAWVTFHHVGVIDERATFLDRLDRFTNKIATREAAIVAALATPRTLDELVAQRFLYPPQVQLPFVDMVERRTIQQHLDRLLQAGRITTDGNTYAA